MHRSQVATLLSVSILLFCALVGCETGKPQNTQAPPTTETTLSTPTAEMTPTLEVTATPQSEAVYVKRLGRGAPFKATYRSAVVGGKLYIMVEPDYIDENHPETFLNAGRLYEYDPAVDVWIEKARLPEAKFGVYITELDGKLYALGGTYIDEELLSPDRDLGSASHDVHNPDDRLYEDSLRFTNTVHAYDPALDQWTARAAMNVERNAISYIQANGRIFAIGGTLPKDGQYEGIGAVEAYDPKSDQWSTKEDMPTPGRYGAYLIESDGVIYAIPFLTHLLEAYDVASDSWTESRHEELSTLPIRIVPVNAKLYVVGFYGRVEVYDPISGAWEGKATLSDHRGDPAAFLYDSRIFYFGGMYGTYASALSSSADYYDIETDRWLKLDDMEERKWCTAISGLDGAVYVIGGRGEVAPDGSIDYYDTVEIYYRP